ncbi:hypothetical protein B0H11DRAFT_2293465, partial [Mycena galericulata]
YWRVARRHGVCAAERRGGVSAVWAESRCRYRVCVRVRVPDTAPFAVEIARRVHRGRVGGRGGDLLRPLRLLPLDALLSPFAAGIRGRRRHGLLLPRPRPRARPPIPAPCPAPAEQRSRAARRACVPRALGGGGCCRCRPCWEWAVGVRWGDRLTLERCARCRNILSSHSLFFKASPASGFPSHSPSHCTHQTSTLTKHTCTCYTTCLYLVHLLLPVTQFTTIFIVPGLPFQ